MTKADETVGRISKGMRHGGSPAEYVRATLLALRAGDSVGDGCVAVRKSDLRECLDMLDSSAPSGPFDFELRLSQSLEEGQMERAEALQALLSEGLDLCVRARNMDSRDRRNATLDCSVDGKEWVESGLFDQHVDFHNLHTPHAPLSTVSATVPLWAQDQYDRDLYSWEQRTRGYLLGQLTEEQATTQEPQE